MKAAPWQQSVDVQRMMRKYAVDRPHAEHVTRLADVLFEQFAPLHQLTGDERAVLQIAARLHDIGHFVAERAHHKHSAYLIRADDGLAALPSDVRDLVAWVARNHRKRPRTSPQDWSKRRKRSLAWLSSLLRVADALDYEHRQQARIARVQIEGPRCRIEVGGYDLGQMGSRLERKAELLACLIDRPLLFEQADR